MKRDEFILFEQAGKIAVATLASRILGFLRDLLVVAALGSGADVFFMAFRIPNVMRRLTGEGILGMEHVARLGRMPVVSGSYDASGSYEKILAISLLTACRYAFVLLAVALGLAFMAPWCMALIAPGFESARLVETTHLFRWCLPYLPLAAISAILGATLISLRQAGYAAFSPVLLNTGMIALGAGAFMTGSALFFAWGVLAGGLLQVLWLACGLARIHKLNTAGVTKERLAAGLQFFAEGLTRQTTLFMQYMRTLMAGEKNLFSRFRKFVLSTGRMCLVVTVGASTYLFFFMGSVAASFFVRGSVSALYLSERLVEFPLALVGASLGMAIMPCFSQSVAKGRAMKQETETALRMCCFLLFPAAAGCIGLSEVIVQVLFAHGAYGSNEAAVTAGVLRAMGVGLPALGLNRLLLGLLVALESGTGHGRQNHGGMRSAFHSLWMGGVCIVGISAGLGYILGVNAVAWGIVAASWLQCGLLWRAAVRHDAVGRAQGFLAGVYPLCAGAVVLGAGLWRIGGWLSDFTSVWQMGGALLFIVAVSVMGWIVLYGWAGRAETGILLTLLSHWRRGRRIK